ncbi:MAG: NUDIX domain-containing protein [Pseudomonadota bacterium]
MNARAALHKAALRAVGAGQRLLAALSRDELPPFACVAAVIERDGALLLLDRADGTGLSLPGGYARLGEQPAHAVVREVREETGYHVQVVALLDALADTTSRVRSINVVYACKIVGGALRASHEGTPRWEDPRPHPERLLPVTRRTLERLGFLPA